VTFAIGRSLEPLQILYGDVGFPDNARKHQDVDMPRPCPLQGTGARRQGRPGGQHVVDQQDAFTLYKPGPAAADLEGAGHIAAAGACRETALARG